LKILININIKELSEREILNVRDVSKIRIDCIKNYAVKLEEQLDIMKKII